MDLSPHDGVLIVGAGPAGLTLALALARAGVLCRVVERALQPSPHSRAICLHARTLEGLAPLGVSAALVQAGHRVDGVNVYCLGQPTWTAELAELESAYPFVLDLTQVTIEAVLTEHAKRAGARIDFGVELVEFERTTTDVGVLLRHADGHLERGRYQFLAGCDGAHSRVRAGLGEILWQGGEGGRLALADVELRWPVDEQRWHWFLHPAGNVLAYPMGQQRWRLTATLEPDEEALPGFFVQRLAQCGAPVPEGLPTTDVPYVYAFTEGRVQYYSRGRCFLLGDAAQAHRPAGNQGLNIAIQDALNLAWKLALVARGEAPVALLDTYHNERAVVGAEVGSFTGWILRELRQRGKLAHGLRARLLEVAGTLQPLQQRWSRRLAGISQRYPANLAIHDAFAPGALPALAAKVARGGPSAGLRAPDGIVTHPTTGASCRLLDLLDGRRPLVLLFHTGRGPAEILWHWQGCLEVTRQYGDRLAWQIICGRHPPAELVHETERVWLDPRLFVHRRYGVAGQGVFVIRPDGVLGLRSLPPQPEVLVDYLRGWLL